jgi:RNA polymerase sigma factor (sigma-70 family)
MNEAELLARYVEHGSEDAFAAVVERCLPLVYRTARRQVGGDAHLAEDVTQLVFTAMARDARTLVRHPNLTGWLFVTTRFLATKAVRSERRRQSREQEACRMQSTENSSNEVPASLHAVLDDAVMELKEQDREAILLRYNRGLRLAEIGARLRLTENAAQKRLDRAVEQLRANLARRGITSTATALALAFEQQNAVAVPAGLAGASAKAALAGAVGAAGVAAGLGVSTFMLVTKLQFGVGVAITAVMATASVWHYRERVELDAAGASAMAAAAQSTADASVPELASVRPAGLTSAGSSSRTAAANDAPALKSGNGSGTGTLWESLRSDDLVTMAARLRDAGFTPSLVRTIMAVQVNEKFAGRLEKLLNGERAPFWKAQGASPLADAKLLGEYSQVLRDRSNTLRELLSDDFFQDLVGPGLKKAAGDLPKAKAEAARRIESDYADLAAQIRAAAQGILLPEDLKKLEYLESEKQADLKDLLTPGELAEYQLRRSPLTGQLRLPMTLMNANEEEFRAIYGILASTNPPVNAFGSPMVSPLISVVRTSPEAAEQLKATLGESRYAEYARYTDPEFQRLYRTTQGQGVSVEAMSRAFDVRGAVAQESNCIFSDASLDVEQKRAAFAALAQNARAQIVGALGQKAGSAYAQSASWLSSVERGRAVSFSPNGTMTVTGSLPPAAATPGR